MSSLSDMMSAALAGLLSAALVHFGASDTTDKPQKQPPAAQRTVDKGRTVAAPMPQNDDRFAPANSNAQRTASSVSPQPTRPGPSS